MKTSLYKGLIVEESLLDSRILNTFKILHVEITKERNPRDRWHIYTVEGNLDNIKKLSKGLKDKKWYAHFFKDKELVIVFRNKIFYVDSLDRNSWKEAMDYGLAQGIPKKQLDFKNRL